MFNVTIIRSRDILKYIVIIIAIYFLGKFIIKYSSKKINPKEIFSINTNKIVSLGINTESTIIKNIYEQESVVEKTEDVEEDDKSARYKTILQIGWDGFNAKELENDFGQDEEVALVENTDDPKEAETVASIDI